MNPNANSNLSFNFGNSPSFGAQATNTGQAFGNLSATPAATTALNLLGGTATAPTASFGVAAPTAVTAPFGGGLSTFIKPAETSVTVASTTSALPTFGAQGQGSIALPTFGAATTASQLPSFGAPTTNILPFSVGTTPGLPTFYTEQPRPTAPKMPITYDSKSLNLGSNVGPPAGLTSTTATTQSAAAPISNQLTFTQIEELINKYTLELEEQEKAFINQATQVNTWDILLNNNSNKIIELNDAVEKVKSDQKVLEDELKFIEAQHTELEECITPLKTELDKVPHVDMEKAQIYLLAENLDTQLRQMSEDLKEVIEHLNEVNKLQNPNDPIVQIGRILNAHMNSLQWIESSTSQINGKLDDINKMYDTLRRDTERSLRLTYCD